MNDELKNKNNSKFKGLSSAEPPLIDHERFSGDVRSFKLPVKGP